MSGVAARYTPAELKKIEAAALEFTKPDGSINWKDLFEKHSFPNREPSNIKVKYKALLRKRLREAAKSEKQGSAKRPRLNGDSGKGTSAYSGEGSVRAKKQRRREELKLYDDAAYGGLCLPLTKVKKVMRNSMNGESCNFDKEACAVIAKATEMFILWLAEKSSKVSGQRKLCIDDMVQASKCQEEARFLRVALFNNYVPEGM
uniref:Transcription factor CBF/NF-Y/archaeal histone domain-containing protein n=1 Tax=Lotharella globosa TaxID=91324 RepID=A0A6V3RXX7_9EUKA|mmetsp:Transcript_26484/g.51306  ORF Transcript_26484/g.51306 Transcript_26484/m.51306 type:complete len:203 (+) Transcript_26484:322-930(+)